MAAGDIRPYSGGNGGTARVRYAKIDATENYAEGEVVLIASGDLTESADEPAVGTPGTGGAVGISVAASLDAATADSDGTLAQANTDGVLVGYIPFLPDQEFVTRNFEEDDATAFGDTPDENDVGTLCSLRTDGTDWGICVHASSSNRDFVVSRVLDANGRDVAQSGGTGVAAVFHFNDITTGA